MPNYLLQADFYYTYDQLNRIESATANINLKPDGNEWVMAGSLLYKENFTYDQNGNILKAQRNGDNTGSLAMDALTYAYVPGTNKLDYVDDAISGDPYSGDISSQSPGNYDYDKIGNLIKDDAEGIVNIDWTVYGKIKKITFSHGKPDLTFKYDASGNRISKTLMDNVDGIFRTTYYVRDAQGNVMATYHENFDPGLDKFDLTLSEQHIYGSSRLGMVKSDQDLTLDWNTPLTTTSVQRTLGSRSYELSNHLGNVMAVVSDRKIAVDVANDGTTDYFTGEVLSATDYYAFGSNMPGRSFTSGNRYRYTFNGKESDPETVSTSGGTQDYGMRIYNPALGRFLSIDPLSRKYAMLTPYQYASNSPIWLIDIDGLEGWILSLPRAIPRIQIPQIEIPNLPYPPSIPMPPVSVPIPDFPLNPSIPHSPHAPDVPMDHITGEIDWSNNPPVDPNDLSSDWDEITDPRSPNRRDFQNKNTGEKISFDKGKPGETGWEGRDHWHRFNPNKTSKLDEMLDKDGIPVPKGSKASHIEPGLPVNTVPVWPGSDKEWKEYDERYEKYQEDMKEYQEKMDKYLEECNCEA